MRILHVGWGFSPWRRGGLIHYAEDLMEAQATRGHDVAYFLAGRHYPRFSRPRLKRWRMGPVRMFEVVNGPIVSGLELGTNQPEKDLSEPTLEASFERTARAFGPDVVHIQELLCLPSSLIDVARDLGIPTVMTLQDYFPLCATLRLFDADGRICTRLEVGEDCVFRNARAPRTRGPFVADTMQYEILRWHGRLRVGRLVSESMFDKVASRAFDWAVSTSAKEPRPPAQPRSRLSDQFQRRRDLNVERLARVDRLVAQSPRVAEIYAKRGVAPERITTFPFTLAHIDRLRPRSLAGPPRPVTFATLGGCASSSKGSEVVAGALGLLRERGLEGRFRFMVYGGVSAEIRDELESFDGVEIPELYEREDLDRILDGVDVGIVPSMWEEALGYVGLEMIAKGIPLIANPLGGIVEYAREGQTAWLNSDCSGEGLADLMGALITEPDRVLKLHRRVLAARKSIVTPFADHVRRMEAIYGEAAEDSRARSRQALT